MKKRIFEKNLAFLKKSPKNHLKKLENLKKIKHSGGGSPERLTKWKEGEGVRKTFCIILDGLP